MNIFEELIYNINHQRELHKKIDGLVYNWLIAHYKFWTSLKPTKDQIGTLYICPNPDAYPKDDDIYNEWATQHMGWDWCFTNDYQAIKIQYNTVKNQWLDINEENEKVVTFTELLKYDKS